VKSTVFDILRDSNQFGPSSKERAKGKAPGNPPVKPFKEAKDLGGEVKPGALPDDKFLGTDMAILGDVPSVTGWSAPTP
jgi:hypothetical protein